MGEKGLCSLVESNLPPFLEVLAQGCEKHNNKCEEKNLFN